MDVSDQEIKEMLDRLRQEAKFRDAKNERYLKNNPNRGLLVQLGDSIDKFLTGSYARDPGPSGLTKEQQQALIEGPEGAAARVARIKAESDALVDAARKDPNHQYHDLFQQAAVLSNEPDARASEMERMRQQYGAGASFWNTDEGKDLLLDTMSNQYTGDKAGLPEFYANQQKAGIGQIDQIIKAMGYEGPMAEWAKANPALALREYNKRQPNSYSGTGPSDEEIKAAMEAGQFSPSAGSPNPLGETGMARESNTAQTAAAQPVDQQRQLNLDEVQKYMDSGVPGLKGKQMFGEAIKKKVALTPTQLRNDPFLR
jgi:hypothetical protein